MPRVTRLVGARVELLAGPEDERCTAETIWDISPLGEPVREKCYYKAGHHGPHYVPWYCWGNPDSPPSVGER
jgi:hypothetical protein